MKKMKKTLLLHFGLLAFVATAQNSNFLYNKLIVKAQICAKYKKYDKAILLFEEARKYKPDNHFFYQSIANFYLSQPEKYDSVFANLEKTALYGVDPQLIEFYGHHYERNINEITIYPNTNDSSDIGKSPKWNEFLKKLPSLRQTYYCTKANIELSLKIRELVGAEQSIRSLEERLSDGKICDIHKILMSSWIDSLNLVELIDIIKSKGFPKYPKISTQDQFSILCLHISMSDDPNARLLMDSLKENVLANRFSYDSYMHILDRELTWKQKKKQKFGWFYDIANNTIDPIEDIGYIDKTREAYNIPSLYEQCLLYSLVAPKGYIVTKKLKEEYDSIIK